MLCYDVKVKTVDEHQDIEKRFEVIRIKSTMIFRKGTIMVVTRKDIKGDDSGYGIKASTVS